MLTKINNSLVFSNWNFSKSSVFQFRRLDFGMILLGIGWELGLDPLIEVEDGI